ncbi:MAG: ATP-binding protein [Litorimonas sp.]
MLVFFNGLERFLRIDRFTTKSELMRARAVYMMGLAFIATQVINMTTMSYSYGGLTFDHLISAVVCALVIVTIATLRFSSRFQLYAGAYSVLIIAGTLSSALNQNTGINSALIPFFVLGVVANGFICGWRATTAFGTVALAIIWGLWWVSSVYDYTPIFDVEKFADRNFQRAVQASLATVLITMMAGFFSKNMHEAFGDLEAGIAAAQNSDRAKTNFLATMSHELCTPMNGIIGMNDILEETDLDEDQKELTSIIRESGRDLQTIIGNVLLFSQLEAGRVSLDDSPFNIRKAISEATAPYKQAIDQKNLKLQKFVADSVPVELIGDKVRTVQILKALIDNAVKFTDQGTIRIEVHGGADAQGHTALLFSIADTGIGIAETHHERIFERFTQEDGSIKRRHGGTGLGLTLARDLAELMGGAVNVKSQLGKGSTFTVRLAFETAAAVGLPLQAAAE